MVHTAVTSIWTKSPTQVFLLYFFTPVPLGPTSILQKAASMVFSNIRQITLLAAKSHYMASILLKLHFRFLISLWKAFHGLCSFHHHSPCPHTLHTVSLLHKHFPDRPQLWVFPSVSFLGNVLPDHCKVGSWKSSLTTRSVAQSFAAITRSSL